MCINMCISNLPLGALQCTIQLSIMPPPASPLPYPPQKNKNKKKTVITWFRKSWKLCVSTETSDTKYMIFSFILDFPFLFAVRISLLLFLHMKYTQITFSRREK